MNIVTHALPGRNLTGYFDGAGAPTVILESGLGGTAEDWAAVLPAVAQFTTVFAYDRAGLGRSDPAPTPRTCREILADLRQLLAAAGLPPPYVLVAHSWSGIQARYFAARFPAEVAGLVLVDAVHPDKYARFAQVMPPEQAERMWQEIRDPARNAEQIDRLASLEQLRQIEQPLSIPLAVITRRADEDPLHQIETSLQAEFLRLSPVSRQQASSSSDHFLQKSDPGLVIEAIRQVVQRANE